MDKLSPKARSENMSRIKSKGMKPELVVRSLVHKLGYRFRLHAPDMPGRPDLVFRSRRKVIFVHGCFWHQHAGCREGRAPSSNLDYWLPKLQRNVERDMANIKQLRRLGWKPLVIWECETAKTSLVKGRIERFLK